MPIVLLWPQPLFLLQVSFGHDVTESPYSSYQPFVTDATSSLVDQEQTPVPVKILRDPGATQSLILAGVLPFSEQSFKELQCSTLRSLCTMCVCDQVWLQGYLKKLYVSPFPLKGITFIVGNDIAGGKVLPVLEILENPADCPLPDDLFSQHVL